MIKSPARLYRDIFIRSEWNIGIVYQPISSLLDPDFRPEIHWLPPPENGTFVADPFGILRDGRLYVLCEEFDYRPHRGVISVADMARGDFTSGPKTAISLPVHMSYPFLLEHQGEVYCIPETFQAREVALYRAQDFPYSWTKTAVLLPDFAALDSTVFRHDDRWWLLCTSQDAGPHEALFVWHAPDLLGPWMPHSFNPVKVDPGSARPAGTPFEHDGHLYRPAQDCSRSYGGRVAINRVDRLTPTGFEETTVAWVGPFSDSPYPHGTHTVSAVGNITLVDAKRDRFIKRAFASALTRGTRRIARGPV